jgi:DNA-directed RNA polymerase
MMLTSLHLWSKGVTFASVHDCYWTHAVDVAPMNQVCRDQFIALHSFPILERVSEYFLQNFMEPPAIDRVSQRRKAIIDIDLKKREMLFKNVPKKGRLDLNVVKDSVYFFS